MLNTNTGKQQPSPTLTEGHFTARCASLQPQYHNYWTDLSTKSNRGKQSAQRWTWLHSFTSEVTKRWVLDSDPDTVLSRPGPVTDEILRIVALFSSVYILKGAASPAITVKMEWPSETTSANQMCAFGHVERLDCQWDTHWEKRRELLHMLEEKDENEMWVFLIHNGQKAIVHVLSSRGQF